MDAAVIQSERALLICCGLVLCTSKQHQHTGRLTRWELDRAKWNSCEHWILWALAVAVTLDMAVTGRCQIDIETMHLFDGETVAHRSICTDGLGEFNASQQKDAWPEHAGSALVLYLH